MKLIFIFVFVTLLLFCRSKKIDHIAILLLSLFFASRNESVPDALPYMEMYKYGLDFQGVEKLFLRLCEFFHHNGISFFFFLFLISYCLLEIWYYCTFKLFGQRSICWMFIFMLSYFGIYYYGVVLRSSISITLCYMGLMVLLKYGLYVKNLVLYCFIVLLAFNIHQSSIIFALAPFCIVRTNKKILYILLVFSLVLYASSVSLSFGQYLLFISETMDVSRFNYYLDLEHSGGVSIFDLILYLVGFVAVYSRDRLIKQDFSYSYNLFLNLFVIALCLLSLVNQIPAGSRLPMNFLFFEFILVYNIIFNTNILKVNRILVGFLFVFYSFFMLLHSFPKILNY